MSEDKDYRVSLEHAISGSEDDFEKNLVYLSAGSLVLSIGFIEKIVPMDNAKYTGFLIVSWCLIALTLLLNLASYLISADNGTKAREDLDNDVLDDKARYEKVKSRNKTIRKVNWTSYTLFSLGIISMIIYCSINVVI
jgi:anaerobic C4-dicarboxylate transporter